jgi:predicted nucleotidyltransferase
LLIQAYEEFLPEILEAAKKVYGDGLITLAVFGSIGRITPKPDSDIDIVIVAEGLPHGRIKRIVQFELVENILADSLTRLQNEGIFTSLSPVLKTKDEVLAGSLLFLDMIEDARIFYDKNNFFKNFLSRLSCRLEKLGAKKVRRGGAWYWVLKEDYKIGEVFEI